MRNWKPKHLAISWTVYWAALASTLWTPVTIAKRLAALPDGHGSIAFGFQNTLLYLTMMKDGRSVYSGSIHLATLLLLIGGPPLLLWLLWILNRPPIDHVVTPRRQPPIGDGTRDVAQAAPRALNGDNVVGEVDIASHSRPRTPVPRSSEQRN